MPTPPGWNGCAPSPAGPIRVDSQYGCWRWRKRPGHEHGPPAARARACPNWACRVHRLLRNLPAASARVARPGTAARRRLDSPDLRTQPDGAGGMGLPGQPAQRRVHLTTVECHAGSREAAVHRPAGLGLPAWLRAAGADSLPGGALGRPKAAEGGALVGCGRPVGGSGVAPRMGEPVRDGDPGDRIVGADHAAGGREGPPASVLARDPDRCGHLAPAGGAAAGAAGRMGPGLARSESARPAAAPGGCGRAGVGPLGGPLALVRPGLAPAIRAGFRRQGPASLAPLIWVLAHLAAYAFRLPATYQHGRYAMPVIPGLLALGAA